mmetsp:Transcript_22616/g.90651  ORF Transcript_22616/g.90651 Transcript_22616/m.90651 type:complete len:126 (+) Transcript_22616:87-464(+)
MDETMSQDLNSAPCCRICHERSDELIKPCNCRGTMATVHQECIQMWLTHRNPDQMTCELCGYPFRMTMRTKSVFCFLFSAGFWWKNLVHIAYIALIARRYDQSLFVVFSFPGLGNGCVTYVAVEG